MLFSRILLGAFLLSTLILRDLHAQEPNLDWAQRDFWQTTDGKTVSDGWEFKDGTISLIKPGEGGSIVSRPMPSHFELSWNWKIEKRVNTGLKYRVRKFGDELFDNNYLGLEYQIIDSKPDDTSENSTAAIYDLVGPKKEKLLNPPGEWNNSRIVANGDYIEHYLNGLLVASATTSGPSWETTVAFSKFYGSEEFGRAKAQDRFMLTDHGGKAIYKDFKFIELDQPQQIAHSPTGPFLANATRNSWADQTSIVIWTRTTRYPEMLANGKPFIKLDNKQAAELSRSKEIDKLLRSQLPENATLEEMIGACPGTEGKVRLSYFPEQQYKQIKSTSWITTSANNDYTAQWKLQGLKPGTTYKTIIEAQTTEGEPSAVLRGSFKTAPPQNESRAIKFCVTTCHDFIRRDDGLKGHKIYSSMKTLNPDFIVHAGDIEYYDKPDPWALTIPLMRFKWGRLFALPNNRDFYNQTTSYFMKDDHDTLADDCWPGRSYGAVTFEEGVQLFNNEQFPSKKHRYQTIRWGHDIQIWILEGRDYRSPNNMPDGPEKTILGKEQKAWLFNTLESSNATYKLVVSPTPVVGPDRANKKDNLANEEFAYEGNQIRQKFSEIPGVIVFCGDRHWQYASVDEKTRLWEFGCGPGSENHELGWKPGDVRPAHRFLRVQGGFISAELSYGSAPNTPQLLIRHHAVSGEQVSQFDFPASFSTPGANQ